MLHINAHQKFQGLLTISYEFIYDTNGNKNTVLSMCAHIVLVLPHGKCFNAANTHSVSAHNILFYGFGTVQWPPWTGCQIYLCISLGTPC